MKQGTILKIIALVGVLMFACMTATATPTPELAGEESKPDLPTTTFTEIPPTDTLVPTDEHTATPVPPTDTSVPPTDTPTPDLEATAAFEATQLAESISADIDDKLREVNLSTEQGYLGWASDDSISFTLNTYNTYDWAPISDDEFSDFVFYAETTWESTSGYILCGFVFRAGPDLEYDEYYIFQSIRWSGWPSWDVEYFKYGDFHSSPTGGVRRDQIIKQDQGSTNEFMIIANGTVFNAYANGESLGGATISKLASGIVGLYAWQESGETTCTFDNAWLWVLEDD